MDSAKQKSGVKILIVQDSPTQAQQLQCMLEQHGYEVSVAANGQSALEMMPQLKPALLISDVNMPEMDGYALCRRVKADENFRQIPLMLVMAISESQDVIRGLECGADSFLIKPYTEHWLLQSVQHVLLNHDQYAESDASLGLELYCEGQRYIVTAGRLRILNLLLSAYNAAIQRNQELNYSHDELRVLKAELDSAKRQAILLDIATGLPSRQSFLECATLIMQSAMHSDSVFALVLIDIRNFGMINESFGEVVGDQLLQSIAKRLGEQSPAVLARIAGNRFAMLLPELDNDAGVAYALQKYLSLPFKAPFMIGNVALKVTARAGISLFPADGTNANILLGNAEAALKQAKRFAVEYMFYTADMNVRVTERLLLESQLHQAITNQQFVLYYQPKFTASTDQLTGFEALIRWMHPQRGLVPPSEFIPILEESGMLLEVGEWVLRQAATDYLRWQKLGFKPPPIAVNVSATQLNNLGFMRIIRSAVWGHANAGLAENGASPAMIDLEITESVLMQGIDGLLPSLQALQDEGFHILIDDFGTGYSSFSYLNKIPLYAIKIDSSFIAGLTSNAGQRTMIFAIILLAHALSLKVIAEGVETDEQHAQLAEMGCDELQGYLLGKPMPSSDVEDLLERQLHA